MFAIAQALCRIMPSLWPSSALMCTHPPMVHVAMCETEPCTHSSELCPRLAGQG